MTTAFGFKLVHLSHLSVSVFLHLNLSAKNLLISSWLLTQISGMLYYHLLGLADNGFNHFSERKIQNWTLTRNYHVSLLLEADGSSLLGAVCMFICFSGPQSLQILIQYSAIDRIPDALTGFTVTLLLTWVPLHSSHLLILTCLSSQRTAIAYYLFFFFKL